MSSQPLIPQEGSPAQDRRASRPMPQTPGFADAFGTRQLVFDPATSTSLEVLRFTRTLSESPDFEGALIARVEALSHVRHASLGSVLSVERISDAELALVSKHTPGKRVSELLPKAHGPAFALELLRLVTPALAALQRSGEDVVHGSLSAERIVVTRDGRLVVVEHVLGSALEAMSLSRAQMIELGLVAPAGPEPVQLTARTDMTQLGFIALSLLLGRRLNPADYPDKVQALLDEFSHTTRSPILGARLRVWLERAMQLTPRAFASAEDAQAALGELPDDPEIQASTDAGLDAFPQEAVRPPAPLLKVAPQAAVEVPVDRRGPASDRRAPSRGKKIGRLVMILLSVAAGGGAVAIFGLPYLQPPVQTIEVRPATTPLADLLAPAVAAPATAPGTGGIQPAAAPVSTPAPNATPASGPAAPPPTAGADAVTAPTSATVPPTTTPAAAATRFGGMTVKSAMDLQVFENGSPIGSTAGPIAIGEGTRAVEFVNEALGFRYRQSVTIKAGQMTTINIAVPNGKVSINASPWAEVDIDGTPAGETPLANLSLPIGTHEITFRHPQLGTKKQTVIVKVEGLTKVTQVFQQESIR